jgi:hypothetical protein
MPTDLQTVLATIPVAEEGHVITREYHNSLRTALLLLADQLGTAPIGGPERVTYPPTFLQNGDESNWRQENGLASVREGNADGVLSLQLPQGARIQSLTVTGRRLGTVQSFRVELLRLAIDDPDGNPLQLASMSLTNASDPFRVTQSLGVSERGLTALDEFRITDQYTYLIHARVVAASNLVQINGIQVAYIRS